MTATLFPQSPAVETKASSLWRPALKAGVVAAVATSALAAVATAAGISFEVEGEAIPLAGYAQMTILGAVLGLLLAAVIRRRGRHPQQTFVRACVALTALSFLPDLTTGFDAASAITLIALHVVAAVIIVPRIADELPR